MNRRAFIRFATGALLVFITVTAYSITPQQRAAIMASRPTQAAQQLYLLGFTYNSTDGTGSAGDLLTPTIIASSVHGFGTGTWTTSPNPLDTGAMKLTANPITPLTAIVGGANTYSTAGTLNWVTDNSIRSNEVVYSFTSVNSVSMGIFIKPECGTGYAHYNYLYIGGQGDFVALALEDSPTTPVLCLETESYQSPVRTLSITSGATYWVTLKYVRNAESFLMIYSGTTGELLFSDSYVLSDNPCNQLYVGRTDAHDSYPATKTYFGHLVVDEKTAKWPLTPTGNWIPVAPSISSVSSGTPLATTATITWSTDLYSDSTVEYGETSAYGDTATSSAGVTSHSVEVTGLSSSTTYHYRVKSTLGGKTGISSDGTFTTASACSVFAQNENNSDWIGTGYSQKIKNTGESTICQIDMLIYSTSGSPSVVPILCASADGSGTTWSPTAVTVSETSPAWKTFTFSSNPTITGDFYLILNTSNIRWRCDTATGGTRYEDTDYAIYSYPAGNKYGSGTYDFAFRVYAE